jgi:hypothetical protein
MKKCAHTPYPLASLALGLSNVSKGCEGLVPWLTLFGSLDHKFADLLLYPFFSAFGALYFTFLIFAYGHNYFKRLITVHTPILVSRHDHTSCLNGPGQRVSHLFCKDYSEL